VANPNAQVAGEVSIEDLLARPYVADPLRAHDCAPVGDGAAVVILASAERARDLCDRPAWITWFGHRVESAALGARDLVTLAPLGPSGGLPPDVAELHAPFTHQEIILREALGIGGATDVNPSGGALVANPMFAAGLARVGCAAQAIMTGRAERALAHATSGPVLQQNLVCMMEAR
jgi:acetyl-CoA acetyltransferase